MKILVYILNYIYIFVVRTINYIFYGISIHNIKELSGRRKGASPSSKNECHSLFVRSDLSAIAQISKTFIMRTNNEGGNATASLLAQRNVQSIVQKANELKTNTGFVLEYFNNLPFFQSKIDAYNYVSVMHYNCFGVFKFNSYQEFRSAVFESK